MEKVQEEAGQIVYTTSFPVTDPKRLLGGKCEVEVVVNLEAGTAMGILSLKRMLSGASPFRISLEYLKAISKSIKAIKTYAFLLDDLLRDAADHRLKWEFGGANMTVVRPKGGKHKFTLMIGDYHEEGSLFEDTKELDRAVNAIDEAVKQVEKRIEEVMNKIKKKKK